MAISNQAKTHPPAIHAVLAEKWCQPEAVLEHIDEGDDVISLLYLPSYSPDLNPLEKAFSKAKGLLRKAGAHAREALVETLGAALGAVTPGYAHGFFRSRGYRNPSQLL